MKILGLLISHGAVLLFGFGLGIYSLPILIQPTAPHVTLNDMKAEASEHFSGEFSRERADSDFFHWGEGRFVLTPDQVQFEGELAPGPDYKLYLAKEFIETEDVFLQQKANMALIGDVKTFTNFTAEMPKDLNPADYNTLIVWCETFGEFITSGQYQP